MTVRGSALLSLTGSLMLALPAGAQLRPPAEAGPAVALEAAPVAAWGENRRAGVGGRVDLVVASRVRVQGEGMVFFPDLDVAEPTASASHSSTQLNANVLLDLNRRGPVRVYLGLGLGYTRLRVDLTVDGRTEGATFDTTGTNRIVGIRVPLAFGSPFVEWNSQLRSNRPWVVSGGVSFRLGG